MRKRSLISMGIFLILAMVINISLAVAYIFIPDDPRDTDSGVLIDNFKVVINGAPVNSNFDFETGGFEEFLVYGDTKVIDSLGPINPPGGSYMALLTTGLGSCPSSAWQTASLGQIFTVPSPVSNATVSLDYNLLTNADYMGAARWDWFFVHLWAHRPGEDRLVLEVINTGVFDPAFTFIDASGTGFSWQTGFQSFTMDITAAINDAIADGFTDFSLYAEVGEYIGPIANIVLGDHNFITGESLVADVHVTNEGWSHPVEVKLWIKLPNCTLMPVLDNPFFTFTPPPYADITERVFTHTFTGSEPEGEYRFGVRLQSIITGREFSCSVEPFWFTP